MKRLAVLATLLVLTASFVPARGDDKDTVADTPYYPLKVGNTWTYSGPKNVKIVTKVAKHEKVGNQMCAKLESTADGMALGYEHIAVMADGIYRIGYNGQAAEKPILILKLPPKKGEEWKFATKLGDAPVSGDMMIGEDKVTVPAGTYEAVVVMGKLESRGNKVEGASYYVKNVGIAKYRYTADDMVADIVLEKFEPAK